MLVCRELGHWSPRSGGFTAPMVSQSELASSPGADAQSKAGSRRPYAAASPERRHTQTQSASGERPQDCRFVARQPRSRLLWYRLPGAEVPNHLGSGDDVAPGWWLRQVSNAQQEGCAIVFYPPWHRQRRGAVAKLATSSATSTPTSPHAGRRSPRPTDRLLGGHSYGRMIITEAGADDRFTQLLYVTSSHAPVPHALHAAARQVAWQQKPVTYFVCTEDLATPAEVQHQRVKADTRLVEFSAGHHRFFHALTRSRKASPPRSTG
jgi:hypothetical protein